MAEWIASHKGVRYGMERTLEKLRIYAYDHKFYAGPAWDYDLSFGNMRDGTLEKLGIYSYNR